MLTRRLYRPFAAPLARGAKKGGARGLGDALDGLSASGAWGIGARIDMELMLKPAGLAFGIEIIAQSGAASFDGALELALDRFVKAAAFGQCERVGAPVGCQAGGMKRFANIDIAQTGDDFLIQKRGLDRAVGRKPCGEDFGRES